VPAYYLLSLSDLAREGIRHSGSYRFADHIYVGKPSGRTALGRWLDARLLSMPAARAFRCRYREAKAVVRRALESHREARALRVLAVPCGIPRDIIELAHDVGTVHPGLLDRLEYHGMDIDPEVLDIARTLTRDAGIHAAHYHVGDALSPTDYPRRPFDVVISTGLGEFLDDDELEVLYRNIYAALDPGGIFYTSATAHDSTSETLLRIAELTTQYRNVQHVKRVLSAFPWKRLAAMCDATGLQTFVTAVK
jgi:SAM-dependent methyltransferase